MPLRSLPLPPLPLKKKLGAKIGIPQSFVCSSNEKPTWIPRRVSFQRIPGRVLRRGGTTQPSTSTQIYVECFLDWLGELGHLLLLVRWRRYSKNLTKAITEFLHSATTESAANWSKSYFCCKWFWSYERITFVWNINRSSKDLRAVILECNDFFSILMWIDSWILGDWRQRSNKLCV